jgi:hypothetical protein
MTEGSTMKMNSALSQVWILLLVFGLVGCTSEPEDTVEAIPYPLETCLVSDELIGEDPDMEPYAFVHEGQEIKLCCKSCLKSFDKEPEKYLVKLRYAPEVPPAE